MSHLDDLFAPYPEHLSVEELSQVLGVTRMTVYRWLQQGKLPAYKLDNNWIVLRDEIRDHVAAGRNTPPPAT